MLFAMRWRLLSRLGLAAVLFPLLAEARGGGGEHFSSGSGFSGGDGDGADGFIVELLIWLVIRYPEVGIPLALVVGVAWFVYQANHGPKATTQRAFQKSEAELRTAVSGRDVQGWVNALKLKDPAFELLPLLDKVKTLFLETQQAWFKRDLSPVRPFVSDATYQRLKLQLALLRRQGVRDALTDVQVLDVQIIGLDQSQWFDSVHIRVKAQMRDTDVPATHTEGQAIAAAKQAELDSFTEVWTFVRKPGAKTRIGEDLYQGKCPNCGAPFNAGAMNNCDYCGAVVNSGNFDWTLSEITQGSEHIRHYATVDGLMQAREADPALNLEMLEDRASLIFWNWVDAHSTGEVGALAKVSSQEALAELEADLDRLSGQGRRRVFLECAVGGAITRLLRPNEDGYDEAHVEIRWSAKTGVGPVGARPPELPTVPQRSVLVLVRKGGAQTPTANGMSTNRCLQCNAALTDTATPSCDFCGALLSTGERDWVLRRACTLEQWNALETQRYTEAVNRRSQLQTMEVAVLDVHERERLLYMMAAVAAADGVVSDRERKLMKLCSERWMVPWQHVELALDAGPQMFDRLVAKGSSEATAFLRSMVNMALVDGRIDRKERQLLEAAAMHLGVQDQLATLMQARRPRA